MDLGRELPGACFKRDILFDDLLPLLSLIMIFFAVRIFYQCTVTILFLCVRRVYSATAARMKTHPYNSAPVYQIRNNGIAVIKRWNKTEDSTIIFFSRRPQRLRSDRGGGILTNVQLPFFFSASAAFTPRPSRE